MKITVFAYAAAGTKVALPMHTFSLVTEEQLLVVHGQNFAYLTFPGIMHGLQILHT